jgi:hypothetical protein
MENLIEVRNKYISKVQNKITKLSKSLDLLTQLDKTLINNIKKLPQSGGSALVLTNLGLAIANNKVRLDKLKTDTQNKWAEALTRLAQTTDGLKLDINHLTNGINMYTNLLEKMNFDSIDFHMPDPYRSDDGVQLTITDEMLHLNDTGLQKIEQHINNLLDDNIDKNSYISGITLTGQDYATHTPQNKHADILNAVKQYLSNKFLHSASAHSLPPASASAHSLPFAPAPSLPFAPTPSLPFAPTHSLPFAPASTFG